MCACACAEQGQGSAILLIIDTSGSEAVPAAQMAEEKRDMLLTCELQHAATRVTHPQ